MVPPQSPTGLVQMTNDFWVNAARMRSKANLQRLKCPASETEERMMRYNVLMYSHGNDLRRHF